MKEEWARGLVVRVLKEAVRRSGSGGVVIAGQGPEADLLSRWVSQAGIPSRSPSPKAVALARELLGATSPSREDPAPPGRADPTALASLALARQVGFLLLGTATKTTLLLSPDLPLEPVLPLGDLFATDVLAIQGRCTVPRPLEDAHEEMLRAVDTGLQEFLEEGTRPAEALPAVVDPLRSILVEALQKSRSSRISHYLVPMLRGPTPGIDLDL